MKISTRLIRHRRLLVLVLMTGAVPALLVGVLPRVFAVANRTFANARSTNLSAQTSQAREASLVQASAANALGLSRFTSVTLTARYSGPGNFPDMLSQNQAQSESMTSADMDGDGVPDLACGYAMSDRGAITIQPGNIDSIYPNSVQAKQRKANGDFVDAPFLPEARLTEIPLRPDFLAAGDFDGDGHQDMVAAQRGINKLCFALGDGMGGFRGIREIELPGPVTAFASGDVNRPDGLADVVVGVASDGTDKLLVFSAADGAMRATPDIIPLPGAASAIATGRFVGSNFVDIAVGCGDRLLIVHGRDANRLERNPGGGPLASPAVSTLAGGFQPVALAAGSFVGPAKTDLAVLSSKGKMYVASHSGGRGVSPGHWSLARWAAADITGSSSIDTAFQLKATWLPGSSTQSLAVVDGASESVKLYSGRGAAASTVGNQRSHAEMDAALTLIARDKPVAILAMRLNTNATDGLVVLTAHHSQPSIVVGAVTSTFTVLTTDDSGPDSLRQAILNANSSLGIDAILFNIPGPSPHTINLLSPLPAITEGVTIDGTSNPDFAGTPVIELNGAAAGPSASGLQLAASGCTIRGLVLNRFSSDDNPLVDPTINGAIALLPDSHNAAISSNLIEGNYIGVDPTGTRIQQNTGVGILINSASNTAIGGTTAAALNVISGNGLSGIYMTTGAGGAPTSNQTLGNHIGTDVTGTFAIANGSSPNALGGHSGVLLNSGPGSAETIQGNVISGNVDDGITSNDQAGLGIITVANNLIGTDVTGEAALGNGGLGIDAGAQAFTIQGNLVSANGSIGIEVSNNVGTMITGNKIGTDQSGGRSLGNEGDGILVLNSQVMVVNNLVAGNASTGIEISGVFSLNCGIQGNHIGTNSDGTVSLSNGKNGIFIHDGPQNTQISGNVIADNSGSGIRIPNSLVSQQTLFNKISQNLIFGNTTLGIDLGPEGVTQNPLNQLTGANNLQNFPTLTSATIIAGSSAGQLTVTGTLQASPATAYSIEFFFGQSCGQLGHQELSSLPIFLGSVTVTTDGTGNAGVTFSVAVPANAGSRTFVNATATDPKGNTSEFCECVQAAQQCPFTLTPASQSFGLGGGPGTIVLTGSSTCAWTAVSQAPWLTIQSGSSGTGPGTVTYTAAATSSASTRTGSLVVAGIPFTVTELVNGPTISTVTASGNNLIVSGLNFDSGSVVLLNSQPGRTKFRDSSTVVGKKLLKQIAPGQTVTIQVVTSANVLSPVFNFTRSAG